MTSEKTVSWSYLLVSILDLAPGAGFYRRRRGSQESGETIEANIMPFREGEVSRCPEADCECEVTVTNAAPPSCTGPHDAPTCRWGNPMVKK